MAGFRLLEVRDGFGPESLVERKAEWRKYVGQPMVQLWEFRRA